MNILRFAAELLGIRTAAELGEHIELVQFLYNEYRNGESK